MAHRAAQVDALAAGQREETEQVATAMTEMTTTATEEISSNASQAAKQADYNAKQAQSIVDTAVELVEVLAKEVSHASGVITRLEGDVQNISAALGVIQDIKPTCWP